MNYILKTTVRAALATLVLCGGLFLYTQKAEAVCVDNCVGTVTFTASPNPVSYNSPATLNWSAANAEATCIEDENSFGFTTLATNQGSDATTNLTATTQFTITCSTDTDSKMKSVTVTVNPPPVTQYDLNITINGSGSVSVSPSGTSCGTNCSRHDSGTSVTMTPSPGTGKRFDHWSGTGCSSGTVSMTTNRNCTAYFVDNTYRVTVQKVAGTSGDGTDYASITSSPAGISCSGTCNSDYGDFAPGTVVDTTTTFNPPAVYEGLAAGSDPVCGDPLTVPDHDVICKLAFGLEQTCSPDFRRDLVRSDGHPIDPFDGSEISISGSTASISVKNNSSICSYDMSLASYYVFSQWGTPDFISTQIRKATSLKTIGPGATQSLSVSLPSCAYQVDLLEGIAPTSNPDLGPEAFDWDVDPTPLCIASCTASPESVAAGGSVALSATGGVGATYSWDMDGSGATCTGASCNATFSNVGTFDIRVRKGADEPWSDPCTVTVSAGGAAPTVNLKGRVAGAGTYIDGPISLPAGGGSVDFQWTTTNSPTSCTASASPSVAGWSGSKAVGGSTQTGIANGTDNRTYTIECTNTYGSDTDSVDVTVAGVSTFPLTVTKSGAGSGTVTSSPAGINCGADCSESYNSGTQVTLSQTATAGSVFGGWTGACSGTGSCVVAMNAAQSVGATFNLVGGPTCSAVPTTVLTGQNTVITASGGSGGTSPVYTWNTGGGSVCGPSDSTCTTSYASEGQKTVTVTRNGQNGSCPVTVSSGQVVVHSNLPTQWQLTTPSGNILDPGSDVTDMTYSNQSPGLYTIIADPKANYTVSYNLQSQTLSGANNPIIFTITYVSDGTGPGVDLKVNGKDKDVEVVTGKTGILTWTTSGVNGCVASGGWSGSRANNMSYPPGEESTALNQDTVFTLTCTVVSSNSNGGQSNTRTTVSDSVNVTVRPPQCSDSKDNDGDGITDFSGGDPGCRDADDDDERDAPECSNGQNDDIEDELIDYPNDPGCSSANDDDESNTSTIVTQCNDGLDNDADTFTDFPNDPGCESALDPNEVDDPDIREI